jgi:hypothetical protein
MSAGFGISAGSNVLGGFIQAIANEAESQNMFRAYQDELKRQGVYQQQATQATNQNITDSSSQNAQQYMNRGIGQREAAYGALGNVPLSVSGTGDESSAYKALDTANYNQRGQERAKLGGYADWQQQQNVNNQGTQRQLNQISNFAGGLQNNVFPYQMYQAQHGEDEAKFWGQVISSMGGLIGNYVQANTPPPTQYPMPQYGGVQQYASPIGPSAYTPIPNAYGQYQYPIGPQQYPQQQDSYLPG